MDKDTLSNFRKLNEDIRNPEIPLHDVIKKYAPNNDHHLYDILMKNFKLMREAAKGIKNQIV